MGLPTSSESVSPPSKRSTIASWWPLAAGLVLGAGLGGLIFFRAPVGPPAATPPAALSTVPADQPGLSIGSLAPEFELAGPDGSRVRLSDLRGQVVLLNFWATWCVPCRAEMPLIEEAYRRRQAEGFVALGIDFDEPADLVTAFAEELGLSFPLLLDPGGLVQRQYRVVGYPSTVVVDREGRISSYHIGILARSQLDEYLAEAGIGP